jgi:hypothetical protein
MQITQSRIHDVGFFKTNVQDIAKHITPSLMLGSSRPRLKISPCKSRNHAIMDTHFFKTKAQDIVMQITPSRIHGCRVIRNQGSRYRHAMTTLLPIRIKCSLRLFLFIFQCGAMQKTRLPSRTIRSTIVQL